MKFQRVVPNHEYRKLRLLSDGGKWELGLSDYAFRTRLRMGLTGRPPGVMDFCLGGDAAFIADVLTAVIGRLDDLDENAEAAEVHASFPWGTGRPDLMNHFDPTARTFK